MTDETFHLIELSDETLARLYALGYAEPIVQWRFTKAGDKWLRGWLRRSRA